MDDVFLLRLTMYKNISNAYLPIYSLNIAHEFYEVNNLPLEDLYKSCGFKFDDLKNEKSIVSVDDFLTSLDLIASHLSDDDKIEDELIKHIEIPDLGILGFTLISAPTLENALELIMNGASIAAPSFSFKRFDLNEKKMIFTMNSNGMFKHYHDNILNFASMLFYKLMAFFVHDFARYQAEHKIFFRENELRERVIAIPINMLKNKSNMKNLSFYHARKKEILNEVKRYNKEEGLVEKVEDLIKEELSLGVKPQVQQISEKMGVSPKTLSRKLQDYGSNYQTCVHNMVYLTALDLIKQGLNTKEIAYSLGFSAISGLDYVFHKKTGMSVMQYKKEKKRINQLTN